MAERLPRAILTIDGPAGTGKSTVAHRLARRLGLEFLDTGAMYRAAALLSIEMELAPDDGESIAAAIRAEGIRFDWTADPPTLLLGARDISDRVRDLDVSGIVSIVAAEPAVRRVLVARQKEIGTEHPRLVTEGRDQGSVVFPDAPVRFYMHADAEVRAARRVRQLAESGRTVDADQILADIRARDAIDSTRADGPLVKPEGAIEIDTSDLTLDQVVDQLETIARRELGAALAGSEGP